MCFPSAHRHARGNEGWDHGAVCYSLWKVCHQQWGAYILLSVLSKIFRMPFQISLMCCADGQGFCFSFFFFFLAVFHRVQQRWSRSPWIRNLAARGTWSLAKASALRSHTRWRTFFTCSSEEAWPSACGSARSTFSDVLAGLEMNHQLPSRCWLYLFRQVRSGRYQPLRQEPGRARCSENRRKGVLIATLAGGPKNSVSPCLSPVCSSLLLTIHLSIQYIKKK